MIHKFHIGDYYILLDVYSGAVHVIDETAYKLLDFADEQSLKSKAFPKDAEETDENKAAFEELCELYDEGLIYSPEESYNEALFAVQNAPIKSMCLNVSHDCNLRCDYCFAAKGDFGGERCLMPAEVGRKAIDFLIKHSKNRRNLEVDFFGGEPLMNFDMVKETVDYARSVEKEHNKNFRFTITTNGVLLTDDKIDYINREMSNVVLSLDGRKSINDRFRTFENGLGCYDRIVPRYRKLVENRDPNKDYYVRGTFTTENLDFSADVMDMYEHGFSEISIEPVVSDPNLNYSIKEEHIPAIRKEYEKLANMLIDMKKSGKHINFFHFLVDLSGGPCVYKRLRGCGCGSEYIAITPNGDIYPCHQFVGKDEWKMGNVDDEHIDYAIRDRFKNANIYGKENCKNCWAKFYCSGGCNANSLQYAGGILKNHKVSCELEKARLECAIMMKAAQTGVDTD